MNILSDITNSPRNIVGIDPNLDFLAICKMDMGGKVLQFEKIHTHYPAVKDAFWQKWYEVVDDGTVCIGVESQFLDPKMIRNEAFTVGIAQTSSFNDCKVCTVSARTYKTEYDLSAGNREDNKRLVVERCSLILENYFSLPLKYSAKEGYYFEEAGEKLRAHDFADAYFIAKYLLENVISKK
jgi:hypothetical protein